MKYLVVLDVRKIQYLVNYCSSQHKKNRKWETMYQAPWNKQYQNVSSTREIFTKFVEWNSHYTVCCIECFFDTITMMYINVDI